MSILAMNMQKISICVMNRLKLTLCNADGLPESFQKMVFTSGRGCAEEALVVCDAEVFPGHPYKVYVYTKDIAEMGCRRIVPSNRK